MTSTDPDRPQARRALMRRLGLADDALPMGGDWYTAEDVLIALADAFTAHKPRNVVALGAGLSTAVMARAAPDATIMVLEHDPQVIEITRGLLERIGARADLIEAELTEHEAKSLWYRTSSLSLLPDAIDFLFVDGPPMFAGRTPRHPAGVHLFGRLSPDGLIFLDDARRAKEKKTLRLWADEFPHLTQTATRGGAAILRRQSRSTSE